MELAKVFHFLYIFRKSAILSYKHKQISYLPPNMLPLLVPVGALVVEILAEANKFASPPPNREPLFAEPPNTDAWVVWVGVPKTEAWVVWVGVPKTDPWVVWVGVPKTEVWVVGVGVPKTDAWIDCVGEPKTDACVVCGGDPKPDAWVDWLVPNMDAWFDGVPNTDDCVVGVSAPKTDAWVVCVGAPKTDVWVVGAPNMDVVEVAPNTDAWVVGVPNIEPVGFVGVVLPKAWFAAPKTEDAEEEVSNTDACVVVPKAGWPKVGTDVAGNSVVVAGVKAPNAWPKTDAGVVENPDDDVTAVVSKTDFVVVETAVGASVSEVAVVVIETSLVLEGVEDAERTETVVSVVWPNVTLLDPKIDFAPKTDGGLAVVNIEELAEDNPSDFGWVAAAVPNRDAAGLLDSAGLSSDFGGDGSFSGVEVGINADGFEAEIHTLILLHELDIYID